MSKRYSATIPADAGGKKGDFTVAHVQGRDPVEAKEVATADLLVRGHLAALGAFIKGGSVTEKPG